MIIPVAPSRRFSQALNPIQTVKLHKSEKTSKRFKINSVAMQLPLDNRSIKNLNSSIAASINTKFQNILAAFKHIKLERKDHYLQNPSAAAANDIQDPINRSNEFLEIRDILDDAANETAWKLYMI